MSRGHPPHLAILGAGPTGLEAALAAAEAGLPFTLYEAGPQVASYIRAWGHVHLFSPWSLNASPRARRRLAEVGRPVPDDSSCPRGRELVAKLLEPLAELPEIAPRLRLGTRVLEIGREGLVKHEAIGAAERASRPFRLLVRRPTGDEEIERADVVLDCTGTYAQPNRVGDGGISAPGEAALGPTIRRHLVHFARQGEDWAGQTILLVGAGFSAQTAAVDLAAFCAEHPGTRVIWALRRQEPSWSVDPHDPLPQRSELMTRANAVAQGATPAVETRCGVVVESLKPVDGRVEVVLRGHDGRGDTVVVDRIVSHTGYVGDHSLYRQLQVHQCYATEGPMKLAAALLGSEGDGDCLSQESHGLETLINPEPGFFILGSKSYGRNSTFLMRVGWQQVEEVLGQVRAEVGS